MSGSLHDSVLLSRREHPFVGWVTVDEFEDLFADLSGIQIVVPRSRPRLPGLLGRVRNRLVGDVLVNPAAQPGELLLVVARSPAELGALLAVNGWRKRFRYVAGYVIDSYFLQGFSQATRHYDHVFTTTREGADHVRTTYGVPSSVLRTGFDCLNWSSINEERGIDVLGFGRQPPSIHRHFQSAFHDRGSPMLYLHSPIGATHGPDVWTERPMMLKLMQRAKLALAFHMMVEPQGDRPRAATFLTNRWLEALASGCIVVGKRPEGEMAEEMLNWPDATLELPDAPAESVVMVKQLASNAPYLSAVRRRNVMNMCSQHDWRYRIRDILQHFGLPIPSNLQRDLDLLTVKRSQIAGTG